MADRYLELNFEGGSEGGADRGGLAPGGRRRARGSWTCGWRTSTGCAKRALPQGRPCTLRATVSVERTLEDPVIRAAFVNPERQNVFVASSAAREEPSGSFAAGETVEFAVAFENVLAPGRYSVSTLIAPRGDDQVVDRWEGIFSFVVSGARATGGLVDLAYDVRAGALEAAAADDAERRGGQRPDREADQRARAYAGDLRRFFALTVHLAAMEFKLRFFGSALGYLWQLVRPLLLFGVLYVVFTQFVRLNAGVQVLPRRAAERDRAVHVLRGLHRRRRHRGARPREPVRKIEFPRLVDAVRGGRDRVLQPGREPARRARLHPGRGRRPPLSGCWRCP